MGSIEIIESTFLSSLIDKVEVMNVDDILNIRSSFCIEDDINAAKQTVPWVMEHEAGFVDRRDGEASK